MKNKALVIFLSILMFFVGGIGGIGGIAYITLPYNEELVETSEVYYSLSDDDKTVSVASGVQQAEEGSVAVHFLELGNKYTGDCTYIKVGTDIDILIDCGSKSNSVATVDAYLKQYVTDGVLEYVIVTHAHQDHYAGFATTTKVKSIFDLYECETIITFSNTNQKTSSDYIDQNASSDNDVSIFGVTSYASASKSASTMYKNFNRELQDELNTTLTKGDREGKNPRHFTANEIVEGKDARFVGEGDDKLELDENGEIVLDSTNDITLQILDSFFYTNEAGTENDYSVCTMLNQGDKHFIFTGDLEIEGEEYLVKEGRNQIFESEDFNGVELYKAGHHGSKTSSSMALLNVIKPRIVGVCCCAGSSEYTSNVANQFPTKQFLINVSQFTTQVYVTTLCVDYDKGEFTSLNGNIVVMAKVDTGASVYCSNNTTLLKDTDWFKNNRLEMCQQSDNGSITLHSSWLQ